MDILGLVFAIFIGITLGLVGSGGSILTVPVLVYLFRVEPNLATTYSLFAIAVSSCLGSMRNLKQKKVDIRKLLDFGVPSVLMVFLTRQFILPLVPEEFHIGPWILHQNVVLMICFAAVMLLSAWRMIFGSTNNKTEGSIVVSRYRMALQGSILGFITGIVGAGGGFLIIPALINFYHMPMQRAVSTSLAIIALNSIFGLAGDIEKFPLFDWNILVPYTGLLIVGMFVGFSTSKYFRNEQLKIGLGYLILLIALFILSKEIFNL